MKKEFTGPRVSQRFRNNGLENPGIESRQAHPASCTKGYRVVPEIKWPERGVDHPPSSRTVVKERVLYLYSSSTLYSSLLHDRCRTLLLRTEVV
jgi:hypothetical protein